MEVLLADPDLDPAKGAWRKKHPPEMVRINGETQAVYVWIENNKDEEDFAMLKEEIVAILDKLPDEPNTRTLFAIIQAFITSATHNP